MQWETATIRVPAKPLLSQAEVAVIVGVSAKTIRRWIGEGRFPAPKRIGGGDQRWTNMAVGVWLAWQDHVPATDEDRASDASAAETVVGSGRDGDSAVPVGEEGPEDGRPKKKLGGHRGA